MWYIVQKLMQINNVNVKRNFVTDFTLYLGVSYKVHKNFNIMFFAPIE